MINRLKSINTRLESRLYARGFRRPELRQMVLSQFWMSAGITLLGILLLPLSSWLAFAAVGSILAGVNFYHLAKSMQDMVTMRFTSALLMAVLFRFLGRLLMSGLVLYICITLVNAPVVALLVGLTAAVGSIFVWGCAHILEHNGKEA